MSRVSRHRSYGYKYPYRPGIRACYSDEYEYVKQTAPARSSAPLNGLAGPVLNHFLCAADSWAIGIKLGQI
eukprot:scaffold269418_cov29-Prasinocladus_malaysianus.AAC.1